MSEDPNFDLKEIVSLRYVDWAITTPMLLLVLLLFLTFHSSVPLSLTLYVSVVGLNYIMLMFGYMGEKGTMDKRKAQTVGFIAFGAMLFVIYYYFIYGKSQTILYPPRILFIIFAIVWCMYGVAAEFEDYSKNMMYNGLDIISKVFFGLGLWIYYGGITEI